MNPEAIIELDQFYAHSPATVWHALTDPALHARWWAAGDVRAVVGHRFELDMGKWGKQPCVVLEVEPERLLKYRFSEGSLDTTISWRLAPEGEGTRLTLVHEGFDLESPFGRQALDGMRGGWPNVLKRLAQVIADGPQ
jgi:uncharacterized protein YndB with AHSA1/START domain